MGVLFLCGIVAGAFVIKSHAEEWLRLMNPTLGPQFLATSDFELTAFRSIRPGMTEQQVRDLIGNPCERSINDTVRWGYTAPVATDQRNPLLLCSVVFDADTRKVLLSVERELPTSWHRNPVYDYLFQRPGALQFSTDEGGAPTRLSPDDPAPHLLLVACRDNEIAGDNVAVARKRRDELRQQGVSAFVLVPSAGETTEASPVLASIAGLPAGNWPYRLFLYRRGELHLVNPAASILLPDQTRADEEWLLKQLR